ncbi:MAG: hypothetical protein V4490_05785 [Pseudomonadota bacterium]
MQGPQKEILPDNVDWLKKEIKRIAADLKSKRTELTLELWTYELNVSKRGGAAQADAKNTILSDEIVKATLFDDLNTTDTSVDLMQQAVIALRARYDAVKGQTFSDILKSASASNQKEDSDNMENLPVTPSTPSSEFDGFIERQVALVRFCSLSRTSSQSPTQSPVASGNGPVLKIGFVVPGNSEAGKEKVKPT